VTALFPGIAGYAATATRLHPRPGVPDPYGSHVGGPLRWPAGEPWPVCAANHLVPVEIPVPAAVRDRLKVTSLTRDWPRYQAAIAELASEIPGFGGVDRRRGTALGHATLPAREPSPLVPVAQLHAADVPDLGAPTGTDLLQVLWCPNDHDTGAEAWTPTVTVCWRRAADVPEVLASPPAPVVTSQGRYVPRPCVLRPERVVEYPWWQELPPELGQRVRAWDGGHDGLYHRQLATAPGWKVGGWPPWPTTDPVPRYCPRCAAPMRHLLQIDSGEWGDTRRWRPVDDAEAVAEPTGVIAGRTGLYRIFHCPACPDAPVLTDPQ
jgi:hypothetical protein